MSDDELPESLGGSEEVTGSSAESATRATAGAATEAASRVYEPPVIPRTLSWADLLEGEGLQQLEQAILPGYLPGCRWFGGKSKTIRSTRVADLISVSDQRPGAARLALVDVTFENGSMETYLLPLQIAKEGAAGLAERSPTSILAFYHPPEGEGRSPGDKGRVLFDGIYDDAFRAALLELIASGGIIKGAKGELHGVAGSTLPELIGEAACALGSRVLKVEQSNSSVAYKDKLFLKLYRKLESGINPDAEIIRFLSERQKFPKVPPFAGALEYHTSFPGSHPAPDSPDSHSSQGGVRVLGLFLGAVRNEGDAWAYALEEVGRYYQALGGGAGHGLGSNFPPAGIVPTPLFGPYAPSPELQKLVGEVFLPRIRQMAGATGEMHLALASATSDPDFAPEAITPSYQKGLCESMEAFVQMVFQALRQKLTNLGAAGSSADARGLAEQVLGLEEKLLRSQRQLLDREIKATLTRTHGDYHLGQVLDTGSDFVIIDFEGEPSRPLPERKLKRSPLRDVAGMLRSFHYAPPAWLAQAEPGPANNCLQNWGDLWARNASRLFLDAYLETVAGASFIPHKAEDLHLLLETFLLEKAVYEVYYELNNRPAWLPIPLRGILELIA